VARPISVLFISGATGTSRRYRCDHQAEALTLAGWNARVISDDDASLEAAADGYDAFVLHRVAFRPSLEWFMRRARESGKPVVYDSGDCLFDPRLADQDPSIRAMPAGDQRLVKHAVWRNRQTLERADAVLVATDPVQKAAARLHQRVYVAPEAVSQSMLASFEAGSSSPDAGHDRDTVTLVLAGCQAAVWRDSVEASTAVRWALDVFPSVRVLIGGPRPVPDELAAFAGRVELTPNEPLQMLRNVSRSRLINLVPLESGNPVSAAASCVPYLEAGVLGVPTIASPNPDFERVIRAGDNGFLADSLQTWQDALARLIQSADQRNEIGARAREDILRRHTTTRRGHHLQALIGELLAERT
jgi:hypothetical protein